MAYALSINAASHGNGTFDRLRSAISQYRTYRRTVNELEALSTRELNDLGIVRGNVREVARSAVYGL